MFLDDIQPAFASDPPQRPADLRGPSKASAELIGRRYCSLTKGLEPLTGVLIKHGDYWLALTSREALKGELWLIRSPATKQECVCKLLVPWVYYPGTVLWAFAMTDLVRPWQPIDDHGDAKVWKRETRKVARRAPVVEIGKPKRRRKRKAAKTGQ